MNIENNGKIYSPSQKAFTSPRNDLNSPQTNSSPPIHIFPNLRPLQFSTATIHPYQSLSLSLSLFPSRFLPLARGDLGWSEPSKLHQHTEASSEGEGVEATFAESGRAGRADSPINFNGRNTSAASVNLTESVIETRAETRMESYRQPRIFSRWPLANCRRPRG